MKNSNTTIQKLTLALLLGSLCSIPAHAGDKIHESFSRTFYGPMNDAELTSAIEMVKKSVISKAELQCNSKVTLVSDFETNNNSGSAGPYGVFYNIGVSADFECANSYLSEEDATIKTAPNYHPGTLRHLVTFKFKAGTTPAEILEVKNRFLALKNKSMRNGQRFIQSIETGAANSFEGADQGKQIGFLVSFKSEGDRNYYVGQPLINPAHTHLYDAAHLDFKNFVGPLLATPVVSEGVFVFDYTVSDKN